MDLFRKESLDHASRRISGEVILAAPLSIRLLTALALLVVVVASVFLVTASYARKETLTGWIVPEGGLIRVTASAGGVVERVVIEEGQSVVGGQPLAVMRLSRDLAGSGDTGITLATALAAQQQAYDARAEAARERLLAEEAGLHQRIHALTGQIEQVRKQASYQQESLDAAIRNVTRFEALVRDGLDSVVALEKIRADQRATEQGLAQLRATLFSLDQQLGDARARLAAIPADRVALEADAVVARGALSERRTESESRSGYEATAPIEGRVLAIPVERGQTVPVGGTLAVLTPLGAQLEAELYAPSRAAGFIRPGQRVRLMYQAFPYQKFGTAFGEVISVSRTVLSPSEVPLPGHGLEQPVFRLRASLPADSIQAYGQSFPLQPGMLLSADIVIERRTLIEWLLDPLYAVGRKQ